MTGPKRVQRTRKAGWRAPLDTQGRPPVYVGRGTRWGNPWTVVRTDSTTGWAVNWTKPGKPTPDWQASTNSQHAAHLMAVGLYREYLAANPTLLERARAELAGHDLMCWCAPSLPCHADALIELINAPKEN